LVALYKAVTPGIVAIQVSAAMDLAH